MRITYYRRPDGAYAERDLKRCKVELAGVGTRSGWDVSPHFATHHPPEYDGGFVITHKATGLRLGAVLESLAHSCAIIDGLEREAPEGSWDFDQVPPEGDMRRAVLRHVVKMCLD